MEPPRRDSAIDAVLATGLPPGLLINPSMGLISGAPTAAGDYASTVQASDGLGGTPSASFGWTIQGGTTTGTTTFQFVRLEALSEVNGNPWSSVAEFNLLDANRALISRSGWQASAEKPGTAGRILPGERGDRR